VARIDSILSILVQQGANELRLAADREPAMLAHGAPKRLSIPKISEETLRDLLGEILSPERETALRAQGRVDAPYDAGSLGTFHVTLTLVNGAPAAVLLRASGRTRSPASHDAVPIARPLRAAPPESGADTTSHAGEAAREPDAAPPEPHRPALSPADPLLALVTRAAAARASDLHLADGEIPAARVDGALVALDDVAPVDLASALPLRGADRDELARGRSIELALDAPGVGRLRLHVYAAADGLAAAVRLLPRAAPSLASLNMPVAIDDIAMLADGLVLVAGATGSGKSTTLAALAQEALRRRSIVLVTLEDPIEYGLAPGERSLVRRRQVGRDTPDFASGLRDALRQDPDVLIVGEMRDPESIALALTAAETGHLVLASIHSRSAASAIERIVDTYPAGRQTQIRVQLADSLRAVIGQRLLPRARGAGRVPALEVLRVTHAVASLIRDGKTAQIVTALQSGRREGQLSLERCLADRVQAGEIRIEDARAAANDPPSLTSYLAR